MIKYYQDRFGGKDAPIEQQGNCFQACVATVLQMPLEEAFDCCFHEDDGKWFDEFNEWLEQYGLGCIWLETPKDNKPGMTALPGIHIVECMSKTLYQGERHVVVVKEGWELLHDPHPDAKEQGEIQGVYIFVPLEPYKLVRLATPKDKEFVKSQGKEE